MRTADINEGDIWADDWSDEFSWFYEGNEYENALTDDLDDIFDANLSDAEDENPEKAAHILEPFLPIEKLPGVCQTQGFRMC